MDAPSSHRAAAATWSRPHGNVLRSGLTRAGAVAAGPLSGGAARGPQGAGQRRGHARANQELFQESGASVLVWWGVGLRPLPVGFTGMSGFAPAGGHALLSVFVGVLVGLALSCALWGTWPSWAAQSEPVGPGLEKPRQNAAELEGGLVPLSLTRPGTNPPPPTRSGTNPTAGSCRRFPTNSQAPRIAPQATRNPDLTPPPNQAHRVGRLKIFPKN